MEPVVALEWISKALEPAEKAKVKAPPLSSDLEGVALGRVLKVGYILFVLRSVFRETATWSEISEPP